MGADAQPIFADAERCVPVQAVFYPALVAAFVFARLHEILDLHHLELAGAKDKAAGGDFVAKRLADLGYAEWQALSGCVEDVFEIDEYALRGFGAQKGDGGVVFYWAYECLEHQVEVAGVGEFAAAIGAFALRELVFAPAAVALAAVHKRVGEAIHVAAGAPDVGVHQNGRIQPDHIVALPYERAPPGVFDVALELHPEGAVVPSAGNAAVDFAALEYEPTPLGKGSERVQIHR